MALRMGIECLDLNPNIVCSLKNAYLTNQTQILMLPSSNVERLTTLSSSDVQTVKDAIAERQLPRQTFTALQVLQNSADQTLVKWKLSTNCPVIDKALRGGFLSGVVSEVTGESACGKTQLCLQLCLSVQMNKTHSGGAVYICTEDVFPSKRIQELIRHQSKQKPGKIFGDNIFIEHVADFESLDHCVKNKLPVLLHRGSVQLVVIDSVTALFRGHYESTQSYERAKHLTLLGAQLQRLATQHNIPVICVNQVSASFSMNLENQVIPALGLTWANQVSCRVMLSRPTHIVDTPTLIPANSELCDLQSTSHTLRKLNVLFAPHLPNSEVVLYINSHGIHGLE